METTQTISYALTSAVDKDVNELLQRQCEFATGRGGSFSITTEYHASNWRRVYTINWPLVENKQPTQLHNTEREEELCRLCAEAFQMVGTLRQFVDGLAKSDLEKIEKLLDNLSEQRIVHEDCLPFGWESPPTILEKL